MRIVVPNLSVKLIHIKIDVAGQVYLFSSFQVYKGTKASEVCQELASKRALPPDLNWALFQDVNKEIGKQTMYLLSV